MIIFETNRTIRQTLLKIFFPFNGAVA